MSSTKRTVRNGTNIRIANSVSPLPSRNKPQNNNNKKVGGGGWLWRQNKLEEYCSFLSLYISIREHCNKRNEKKKKKKQKKM